MTKVALITCIAGQDGAYLAEFLLKKGYIVHALEKCSDHSDIIYSKEDCNVKLIFHHGDLTDSRYIIGLINDIQPDEIYNLDFPSYVKNNLNEPEYSANADGKSIINILEAVRLLDLAHKTRVYKTSVSEFYGLSQTIEQSEVISINSSSPLSKLINDKYRENCKIFVCCGILLNLESATLKENTGVNKIIRDVTNVAMGLQSCLYLSDLSLERNWCHSKDYAEAMWLALQREKPEDFLIPKGIITTAREFIRLAFADLGIEIVFSGKEEYEKGVIIYVDEEIVLSLGLNLDVLKQGQTVVKIDTNLCLATEVRLMDNHSKFNSKIVSDS
jgi:GDPmannose 4,6-dehydratase